MKVYLSIVRLKTFYFLYGGVLSRKLDYYHAVQE
jgi:hypothetical protein